MTNARTPRYSVQIDETAQDIKACLHLRDQCFRNGDSGRDEDRFDENCVHVLIKDNATNTPVASFRLLLMKDGREVGSCYSAQFYDLAGLAAVPTPIADLGRFCIHPDFQDADILRLAWGALTKLVDENRIAMLIGCSSFSGVDAGKYEHSFELLKLKYLAPVKWLPRRKSSEIVEFEQLSTSGKLDLSIALKGLPPLLRTYLLMGGRVSDHAVIDRDLNSIHVFTVLDVADIPVSRVNMLRRI